ncbi:S41 family peptidase [uncultured Chitinophaga sp.]|jgi:Periplasmic protease|uniref:S41 family peptidase n=1 Tax=uncultured Chitinophaga sp. TaxID=339340 RepID=UPI002621AF4B|nr:S41 family peptidase [uncultured Chitinophaga sp.]
MTRPTLLLLLLIITGPCFAQSYTELAQKAYEAYNSKDYTKSASLYIQAIKKGGLDFNNYYNAACCYALTGDKENAFNFLAQAIKYGYSDTAHLQEDTDLNLLHPDPRWAQMVTDAAAIAKRQEKFWDGLALSSPYQPDLSPNEKIAGLSKLWAEVKYSFVNFHLVPQLDWDSLYMAYLPEVTASTSTAEYYKLLTAMIAQLHDGHTNVNVPPALYSTFYARPAFRTRLVEDKVLVVTISDPELRKQGLKEGLELVEINGLPVKDYAEKYVRPFQSSSTPQDLDTRTYEYALFAGPLDSTVHTVLVDEKGKRLNFPVKRIPLADNGKYGKPAFQLTWLKDSIALVALNSFGSDKAAEDFLRAFDTIARASAIIFDVRDNGGGSSNVGYSVLRCLTRNNIATSSWYTRDYRPAYRAWGSPEGRYGYGDSYVDPDKKHYYSKPVVVLTSPRTFSAAEDFAVAFDGMDRGLIIGEPTGGSTGQPMFFALPGGGSARVCSKHDLYPDGKEFIGAGVQPDILVKPAVADLRKGKDTVLEAAIAALKKNAR